MLYNKNSANVASCRNLSGISETHTASCNNSNSTRGENPIHLGIRESYIIHVHQGLRNISIFRWPANLVIEASEHIHR